MQIKTIDKSQQSNNTTFQGKVNVVNDLTFVPRKYMSKAFDSMSKLVENEPFDLFIKQDNKTDTLRIVAMKPEHAGRKGAPFIENVIGDASTMDSGVYTTDLYVATARDTVNLYNNFITPELGSSLGSKIKKFVDKLFAKLSN